MSQNFKRDIDNEVTRQRGKRMSEAMRRGETDILELWEQDKIGFEAFMAYACYEAQKSCTRIALSNAMINTSGTISFHDLMTEFGFTQEDLDED